MDNEEKSRKLRQASEAKRVLAEPLIEGFFANQEFECIAAFKQLPLGSKLEEYQTVHHAMLATERLKSKLRSYVEDYDMMVAQEKLDELTVEGI